MQSQLRMGVLWNTAVLKIKFSFTCKILHNIILRGSEAWRFKNETNTNY